MASHQPFTLYNPAVSRENNQLVPSNDLRKKINDFFTLYRPRNLAGPKVDQMLDLAREKGVLALKRSIKRRYNASLDEADCSEVAWSRIYKKLVEFYEFYGQKKDVNKVFSFTKKNGLTDLDMQLQKVYGESLSQFMRRGLTSWKKNWSSFLKEHHSESVSYELKRFYKFIESQPGTFKESHPFETLVKWACDHSRLEVNEKLLEKYNFCLDDVKMIKGNTNEERKTNLKFQLVEFYQQYDPDRLGNSAGHQSLGEGEETPEMRALDQEAEWGYINLEKLNQRLIQRYNVGLSDNFATEIKMRLIQFYQDVGVSKSPESIDKIVDFAQKRGVAAMNEKLMLTYGKGIAMDGL